MGGLAKSEKEKDRGNIAKGSHLELSSGKTKSSLTFSIHLFVLSRCVSFSAVPIQHTGLRGNLVAKVSPPLLLLTEVRNLRGPF